MHHDAPPLRFPLHSCEAGTLLVTVAKGQRDPVLERNRSLALEKTTRTKIARIKTLFICTRHQFKMIEQHQYVRRGFLSRPSATGSWLLEHTTISSLCYSSDCISSLLREDGSRHIRRQSDNSRCDELSFPYSTLIFYRRACKRGMMLHLQQNRFHVLLKQQHSLVL